MSFSWGNTDIKDIDIWGETIHVFEHEINTNIYCLYIINNKPYVKHFEKSNVMLGEYLLSTLPNYINVNNVLYINPEKHLETTKFNYSEFDLDTLKYLHFGNIKIANAFIKVFGEDYLFTGTILDYKISKIVTFWNKYINKVNNNIKCNIFNIINTKNNYNIKKLLKPVEIISNPEKLEYITPEHLCTNHKFRFLEYSSKYLDYTHNSVAYSDYKIDYAYLGKIGELIKQKILPNNIQLVPLCNNTRYSNLKVKIQVSKNTIIDIINVSQNNTTITYCENCMQIKLMPLKCKPINLYKISGDFYIEPDFIISYDYTFIKTNLSILRTRAKYFLKPLQEPVTSQYNLNNLINFIYNLCADITLENYEIEYKIADYYMCCEYKIYIDNWLIINNHELYIENSLENF